MSFDERINKAYELMKVGKAPIPFGFQRIKEGSFKNDTCKLNAQEALGYLEKVVRVGINKGFDNDAVKKAVKGLANSIMDYANDHKMRKDSDILKAKNNVELIFKEFQISKIAKEQKSTMVSKIDEWIDSTIQGIKNGIKYEIFNNPIQVKAVEGYLEKLEEVKTILADVVDETSTTALKHFKIIVEDIKIIRDSVGTGNINAVADNAQFDEIKATAEKWRDVQDYSAPHKESLESFAYVPEDNDDIMGFLCSSELAYGAIETLSIKIESFKESLNAPQEVISNYNNNIDKKSKLEDAVISLENTIKAEKLNLGITTEQAIAKYGQKMNALCDEIEKLDNVIDDLLDEKELAETEIEVKNQAISMFDALMAKINNQKKNPYVYVKVGEAVHKNMREISSLLLPSADAARVSEGIKQIDKISGFIDKTVDASIDALRKVTDRIRKEYRERIERNRKEREERNREREERNKNKENTTTGVVNQTRKGTDRIIGIFGKNDNNTGKPIENTNENNKEKQSSEENNINNLDL